MSLKYFFSLRALTFASMFFLCLLTAGCGVSGLDVETCLDSGECIAVVEVQKISGEIPLDPMSPLWNGEAVSIDLGPQMITNPKWPDPSVKAVRVQALRSASELAIRIEWEDPTQDSKTVHTDYYTDQAAVMFPLKPSGEPPVIMMGAEDAPVNIWQWKAIWEKGLNPAKSGRSRRTDALSPAVDARNSPVEDLNAEGFSTLTTQQNQSVQGKAHRTDNLWQVVFKRALTNSDDNDVQFKHSVPMAVAVWNGDNRERNGQKGIAGWILLRFL